MVFKKISYVWGRDELKAAIIYEPFDLRLEDIDMPEIGADETLVNVKASGICGTDVEIYRGTSLEPTYPCILGHEWSGEIVDVGEEVEGFKKGDRVVGECVLGCGKCYYCKSGINPVFSCPNMQVFGFTTDTPGGNQEYLKYKEVLLHKIPSNLTYEEGALAEPVSVAYNGIWGVGGGVSASDDVVVFGAGPIGLSAFAIAKTAGARVFTVEPIEKRREMALELGADNVINPKEEDPVKRVSNLTNGLGADLVVEASGDDKAITSLVDVAKRSGRVVLIGHSIGRKIPIEIGKAVWKELTIQGSCDSPHIFPRTLEFMARTKIDLASVITHKFPLEKVVEAFELADKKEESVKILLMP